MARARKDWLKVEHDADEQASDIEGLLKFTRELFKDITPNEWATLPADGSINHDHYLYGAPKRKV